MYAYLVKLRLDEGRYFPEGEADRRALARVVLAMGEGAGLVAFRAAPTVLRVLLRCPLAEARRFNHDVGLSLRAALHLDTSIRCFWLQGARDADRARVMLRDVLAAPWRPTSWDTWHEASSLPDTLGLRAIAPWLAPRVRAVDPNLRRSRWVRHLWVHDLSPRFDPDLLVAAAASAGCVSTLASKEPHAVAAKVAAIAYAQDLVDISRLGAILGHGRTTVYRLAATAPSPAFVRAVALQMSLRTATPLRYPRIRRYRRYRRRSRPQPAHTAAGPSAR